MVFSILCCQVSATPARVLSVSGDPAAFLGLVLSKPSITTSPSNYSGNTVQQSAVTLQLFYSLMLSSEKH